VRSFAEIMTRRRGQQELEGWLTAAEADDQPELHSFANGIRRDQHAVTAGLTLPYSSAAVEGNVNRIILWNLACHGYPCLPCRASMIANDHLAGPGSKRQRGGGRRMETAGISTIRGRRIKFNWMSRFNEVLSAAQPDST